MTTAMLKEKVQVSEAAESFGQAVNAEGVDHFVRRLALVNQRQAVTAARDIRDANGVVLVRQGQTIDAATADRILNHQIVFGQRLPEPVEQQISFATTIDSARLFHRTYALFGKHADLQAIHKHSCSDEALHDLTELVGCPAFVWQKLTVLEQQLPERFDEALFCAWFAAIVARQLRLDDAAVRNAYLAGLLRDVGFLSIPDEVLNKTERLTPAEWRLIQSHVEFSRASLAAAAAIPAEVVAAVAEHHERCDGSGYPGKLNEARLSQLGLIVGLADTLQSIRFKQFAKARRCLYDAVPYLQMNGAAHGRAVANAAITVLRDSGLQTTRLNPCATVAEYAYQVTVRAQNLLKQIKYLEQILSTLKMLPLGGEAKALVDGAGQVQAMIVSSGLTRGELIQWLESLQGEDDDSVLAELNELDLMLNELRWHVQKLTRSIDAFFEATSGKSSAKAHENVKAAADGLRNTLVS